MQLRRFRSGVAALAVVCIGATGCASRADAQEQSKVKCMTQLNDDQKADFLRNEPNGQVSSESSNDNGTQDVCIMEQQPDGSYSARYYNQRDGFADYLLYSSLFGYSNNMATAGLLTGALDFRQYMALSLLSGVNSRGGLFNPYTPIGCGSYYCSYNPASPYNFQRAPRPVVINNTTVVVKHVQYGNQPARNYSGGKPPKPPTGYTTPPLPKAKDTVVNAGKDASGKPTVTPVKGVSAKKVAAGKQQLPSSVKTSSPVTTIAKPKTQTTTKTTSKSGTNDTTKTTSKTQTTTKPANNTPGTVKPAAPSAPAKAPSAPAKAPSAPAKAPSAPSRAPSAPSGRK